MVIPKGRLESNGDVWFPARGEPPKAISGYIRDKGNKYLFHPIDKPCVLREVIWKKVCGGMIQANMCSLDNTTTNFLKCSSCISRKES